MANDLQNIWHAAGDAHQFTQPDELVQRSTLFERKVRRRNWIEYGAGALVATLCLPAAVIFASSGEFALAASMVLTVIGVVLALWNLHLRASAEKARPEVDCRTHLATQYRRQAKALRRVPLWYIGPMLPGVFGVYGTIAVSAAGRVSVLELLANLGLPLAATLAFFGFVIWLNLRAARMLERKLAELEAA